MKSHGRLTYNNVNKVLDPNNHEKLEQKYEDVAPMLHDMADLHSILYKQRHQRGAIDFEEPEAKIIVDDKGKPTDIVLHERLFLYGVEEQSHQGGYLVRRTIPVLGRERI